MSVHTEVTIVVQAVATTEVPEATEDRGGGDVVGREVKVAQLSIHKGRPLSSNNLKGISKCV